MAELADNGLNRKIQDSATISKEVDAVEAQLAELRHLYEQFFLGLERRPPNTEHQAFKKRLQRLKTAFVRQTALKFRINAVQAKVVSYERLWERTLQEIENGTYKRDLIRAKKHLKERAKPKAAEAKEDPSALPVDEIADSLDALFTESDAAPDPQLAQAARTSSGSFQIPTAAAPAAQKTAAPARPVSGAPPAAARPTSGAAPAAARPPAPAAATRPADLSDTKLRAVYDAFVTAKKRCSEDVSKLSFDAVAANLRKQVPEMMKKSGAQSVEFKVVIKDGKAVLRAIPK